MAKNNRSTLGEDMRFQIMMQAALLGISPEEYAEFYANDSSLTGVGARGHRRKKVLECPGEKDAAEKTLTLRVQMQGVTKPPMWREFKVPADFTFLQLHKAIQTVCGFDGGHLWQFQRKAYDSELQIGLPADEADFDSLGMDEWTHDARKTGITAFLAEKGQKLVYVYDFGDDWIFNVSVVKVEPRDGDVAVCTRWKSDVQPIEDSGGVWSYLNVRDAWENRDTLTSAQKKALTEDFGFNSFDDLMHYVSESKFDPETVNVHLADI